MDAADDRPPPAASHLRIARPSRDLAQTERFWVSGLGLQVLERIQPQAEGEHELVILGWPGAAWHLELVSDPDGHTPPAPPTKTCWSSTSAPAGDALIARLVDAGGRVVPGQTPTGTGGVSPSPTPTATGWCSATADGSEHHAQPAQNIQIGVGWQTNRPARSQCRTADLARRLRQAIVTLRDSCSRGRANPCRIFAAPLALASTRWRVQISHFGAVRVRPGVSAFWWRSCLAVRGRRWAAGVGA